MRIVCERRLVNLQLCGSNVVNWRVASSFHPDFFGRYKLTLWTIQFWRTTRMTETFDIQRVGCWAFWIFNINFDLHASFHHWTGCVFQYPWCFHRLDFFFLNNTAKTLDTYIPRINELTRCEFNSRVPNNRWNATVHASGWDGKNQVPNIFAC